MTAVGEHPEHGGPWYIHFWPWFIVILLGTTVVAGISTVIIAVRGADALVADDYYKQGKGINRELAADDEAALREASARVELTEADGAIAISLDILGAFPEALQLGLSHVTLSERDLRVRLERAADGRYLAVQALPEGRFYATLRPASAASSWRLRRRITLPNEHSFVMEPAE